MTVATLSSPAPVELGSNPSTAAAAEEQASQDVIVASSQPSYTPVTTSVEILSARLRSNQRLQSALSTLQAYLPQAVTTSAVKSATQLQQLSQTYGTPLINKVDGKISDAILTILAAPSYGQKKVAAVDEFAFAHTPDLLRPAYTATRTRTLSAVNQATEKVVALKRQRADPLWEKLTSGLDQVSKNLSSMRALLAEAGTNAVATAQIGQRIGDLQLKVTAAVAAAREKGEQARALSRELLQSVSEFAQHSTTFLESTLESTLTEQQAQTVRTLWSRILDTVGSVKDSLHLNSILPSPLSSRNNSDSSQSSQLDGLDEIDEKVPASIESDPVTPTVEEDVNSLPVTPSVEEHILTDDQPLETASSTNTSTASKSARKKKSHKKRHDDEKKQADAEGAQ